MVTVVVGGMVIKMCDEDDIGDNSARHAYVRAFLAVFYALFFFFFILMFLCVCGNMKGDNVYNATTCEGCPER